MSVKVTKDTVAKMEAAIRALTKSRVLVGIPAENAGRDNEPITNAEIGYIQEFGAPEANIPPRAFLVPGIEDAREGVTNAFRDGGKRATSGDIDAAAKALGRAGTIAEAAVRRKITNGPFQALSEATLKKRRARGVTREKPLIDTGKLRDSITYVIRKADE